MAEESTNTGETPSRGSGKALLLGLFVCWQLFYLPSANLIQFVPLRVRSEPGDVPLRLQMVGRFVDDDRLQTLAEAAAAGFARYAEVSGQGQFWKLFSPELPADAIVLSTRIAWADGRRIDLPSPYAPSDPPPLLRLPRRDLRPFHMEANVVLGPWTVSPSSVARPPDAVRYLTVDWAGTRLASARTVMLQSWTRFKVEHPDAADPQSLTLLTRYISKPPVGAATASVALTEREYIRWTHPFGPDSRWDVFDPLAGGFVPLPEDRP